MNSYLRSYLLFAGMMLTLALALGGYVGHDITTAVRFAYVSVLLGIIEISLSFDNVIVNAKTLNRMTPFWQKMFILVGLPIAVFGMRGAFPVGIVSIAAWMNPIDALKLTISHPDQYTAIISTVHPQIMSFGAAFLLLVGLTFMLDIEKDVHWTPFEKWLIHFDRIPYIKYLITGAVVIVPCLFKGVGNAQLPIMYSGLLGMAVFMFIQFLGDALESDEDDEEGSSSAVTGTTVAVAKGGIGMFMYLETLDASFSFDGVIGAFAITTYIPLVLIGLTIGAAAVRSLTLYFVETKALSKYRYLEHGAFWSILVLSGTMVASSHHHEIPEAITGTVSALLIGLAFATSVVWNKRNGAEIASA